MNRKVKIQHLIARRGAVPFALLAILLNSCSIEYGPVPKYNCLLSPDAKAMLYFKTGTYWVYQDSLTHKLDSTYVTTSADNIYTINQATANKQGYGGSFEGANYQFKSSYFGDYMSGNYDYGYTSAYYLERNQDPRDQTTTVKGNITIQFPYVLQNLQVIQQWVTPPLYDSTMILTDQAFCYYNSTLLNNVMVITHSHECFFNNVISQSKTKTYIRKNYGIIRRELPDSNRIWKLIRCNIVQ